MAASAQSRPAEADNYNDYGIDEEIARSFEPSNTTRTNNASRPSGGADVGLEEVQVKKTRKPIPKLDEERLLSQAGIPKLRRITKDRLKLKGKGHEFSDVGRLLNLYQLWLDDLYPKAKFADGLAMIEKLGHSKRMKTMRRAWIDEGKPKDPVEPSDGMFVSREEEERRQAQPTLQDADKRPNNSEEEDLGDGLFVKDISGDADMFDAPLEDDELDALLAEKTGPTTSSNATNAGPSEDVPDELDALMAEAPVPAAPGPRPAQQPADDEFEDDMDALDAMYGT